ncbi:SAM-dependent methyltransferase [Dactylosporangium aurantiacum]|uniref:SAM-dependent methyltransferase n=1 Tax=Dactylosporangium aurantiacum TaxID=35754 RepID=A0A9Q9MJJ1_9ACTN|nr:SAM-dependent methyltransferase [Dactylosporangium aurantiacum]MDG6105712.1 SAM-dependent methyltransferase [Dactylosporangium aurantiacum]UWZ56965.1 SAM-dependent methyltransferase [Dactylosporangium aurantiacum]
MSVDPNRPSAARIYDYFLGGTHNFAIDREVAERAYALVPDLPQVARDNRAFLRRVVRLAASRGVRQFIDIGSGIPTEGNVHDAARAADPDARVVYVDVDPTAVIHSREILGDDPRTAVLQADLHQADRVLSDASVRALVDFDQPVCLLLVAMLHFIPESPDLHEALRRYRDAAAQGSLLAITHGTAGSRAEQLEDLANLYVRTGTPLVLRDRAAILALFDGWELLDPGLVQLPLWRPDPGDPPVEDPDAYAALAAVGVLT